VRDPCSETVRRWCASELGAEPLESVPLRGQVSEVCRLVLSDGRDVVLKLRDTAPARAATCVEAQAFVAGRGFPAPRPLTGTAEIDGRIVHVEEWRPEGVVRDEDDEPAARAAAQLLGSLMAVLAEFEPRTPPLPNPDWVAWDHAGPGEWPGHPLLDPLPPRPLAGFIAETASRVRRRMGRVRLPSVVGHLDWEAQNLRWDPTLDHAVVVHDWDSVGHLPEAAVAGAAAGAFASNEVPTLAPVPSSAAFLEAYQAERGRAFTRDEVEVAWAASLWPAIHNARGEFLLGARPVASEQLELQAQERLRLAHA
jgi:Ser/Thr protein kinase RdoA (MazF antagonist)